MNKQRSTTRPNTRVQVAWTSAPTIRCRANGALHIAGENGGSVDIHAGEVFYLVRSDSNDGSYYVLQYVEYRMAWTCSCPSVKPCKHEIRAHAVALSRYLERKAAAKAAPVPIAPRLQEEWTEDAVVYVPASRRRTANFGTRSGQQGFSLLR